ncbi:MAG: hypothetical protein V1921_02225 [Candidatus Altiarchaeota archaeon]
MNDEIKRGEVSISVGGVRCRITLDDKEFLNGVRDCYYDFLSNGNADFSLNISYIKKNKKQTDTVNNKDNPEFFESEEIHFDDDRYHITSEHSDGYFYPNAKRGEFSIESPKRWQMFSLRSILKACYSLVFLKQGGILVHAVGLKKCGRGFVLMGPSQSGKSSMGKLSGMLPDCKVLSDEFIFAKKIGDDVKIFGTPFGGELPATNSSANLAGLFFLNSESSPKKSLFKKLKQSSILENCLLNSHLYMCVNLEKNPGLGRRIFKVLSKTFVNIPGYSLTLLPYINLLRDLDRVCKQ